MEKAVRFSLSNETINTVCFDLDGTLVEMNPIFKLPLFVFAILRLKDIVGIKNFPAAFKNAVRDLLSNSGTLTNFDVFTNALARHAKSNSIQDIKFAIQKILTRDFPPLRPFFSPVPCAMESLIAIKQAGYRIILATNPVFPLGAIKVRLEGAGFSLSDFSFITHSENMSRTKPRVEYYSELILKAKLDPLRCIMVGNDPIKDLPAHEVGMKTFLVETPKNINSVYSIVDSRITKRGTFNDLISFLKNENCHESPCH
jgi:FMN phosphatase YigB (HAD superfamily)